MIPTKSLSAHSPALRRHYERGEKLIAVALYDSRARRRRARQVMAHQIFH
jgi:hypothetical protein